jgi:hypothetical protein
MPGMRRADRRDSNYDNGLNHPQSRRSEPLTLAEAKQQRDNARADKIQLQQEKAVVEEERNQLLQDKEKAESQLVFVQQDLQALQAKADEWLTKAEEWKECADQNYQNYQQTLGLYNEQMVKTVELLTKYEDANTQRLEYLALYNESQEQLKYERRSKAGIKSWETRRKSENERLKHEIAEMMIVLRNSLEKKDEAVSNLYILAERMDKIQSLVNSVDEESIASPVGMLHKLKRIWLAIKGILSE